MFQVNSHSAYHNYKSFSITFIQAGTELIEGMKSHGVIGSLT